MIREGLDDEIKGLREVCHEVDSIARIMMNALKGVEADDLEDFRSAVPDIYKMVVARLDELDTAVESVVTLALDAQR